MRQGTPRSGSIPRAHTAALTAFGALIALILIAPVLVGCSTSHASPTAAKPMPMTVSVVKAAQREVPVTGEWVGTLDGYVNAQIQPQANGYLVQQDYREGAQVAKGQVLFEIDARPFEAALHQAEGQLGQAKAQLALATINVNRDTPLADAHAIAKSQLDNEVQQKAEAQAAVESAEASVDTAKLNLSFTQVRSLIAGVAGQATTQVGNLVNTQSVLTSVSQLNPIKVYFSISDSEYLALVERARNGGSSLLEGSSKIPLTLTLADGEVYSHKGHIEFVDRELNAQTGAIRIAATFPNPGNVLRPGQFARVSAETEIQHGAVLVPQAAVTEFQGQQRVYTIAANGTIHVNGVTLGPEYGNSRVIESGLPGGSLVVTDNLQKLREGVRVAPQLTRYEPSLTSSGSQPASR